MAIRIRLCYSAPRNALDYPVMMVEAIEQEDGSLQVMFDGKALTCPVCAGRHYRERDITTQTGEWLGFGWGEDKVSNFICAYCGYIFWFRISEMKRSKAGNPPDPPLVDRIFGKG